MIMKNESRWFRKMALAGSGLLVAGVVLADTPLTSFDNFFSDALYASWAAPETVIVDGPTSYSITATGYGSNYKYLGIINGLGETNVELTVTLAGPPVADGLLGPIISLVDGDGTYVNYAFFGQTLGQHVLNAPLSAPSWITAPGTTAGLDLTNIQHLHMQMDPGGFGTQGAYTVTWENLRLTGAPGPIIQLGPQAFNPATSEFTLSWNSIAGKLYTVLYSATVNGSYDTLVPDIPSGGTTTTTTVGMPAGNAGFLRVLQQP
jgi:hypothetical protein